MNKRASVRPLLALALVVAGLASPSAQNQPATADVPRLEFEKYTLPNGLEVILSQKRGLPMVAVNLWYHVGPANEAAGRTGFAHLFEHMMFQSSKHVPPDSHIRLLEAAGASDLNGTTDFDRTNYFETVPANQLELALWLESDRMGYLLEKVDQAALSNQQDVVRNERRQSVENQPYGLAEEALVQAVFPKGHPYYGYVIGSHEDIQAAQLDDVQRFFRQYYAPNNATMAIVGDFEPAEAKKLVEKYFGTLKRGPAVPAPKAEPVRITVRAPAHRALARGAAARLHGVADAGDLQAWRRRRRHRRTILGGGRSSRLLQEARLRAADCPERVGVAAVADARIGLPDRGDRASRATPPKSSRRRLTRNSPRCGRSPPPLREIEMARNTIETNIIGGLERLGGFGGIADRLNSVQPLPGHAGLPAEGHPALPRGDAGRGAELRARAPRALRARRAACRTGSAARRPPRPHAAARLPRRTRAAPRRSTPRSRGVCEMPKPGPSRPLEVSTPASATLSNGLTLILNQRAGVPIVAANLVLKTGSDANPSAKPGLANFVAAMLDEGTATRNALQIADEVAQLGASLTTNSTMDATTVSARSLAKNFPATLNLLADVSLRSGVPGRGDRAAACGAARSTGAAAGQPGRRRRPGRRGGAVRRAAPVWLLRDRHRRRRSRR